MLCRNCGAEVPDHAKFCPKCGTRFEEEAGQHNKADMSGQSPQEESAPVNQEPGSAEPAGREDNSGQSGTAAAAVVNKIIQRPMIIGIIIAAVVVVAVVLILLFAVFDVGKTSINLDEYLVITTEGYDGFGTARATIDKEKLESDYKGKIKLTGEGKKDPDLSSYVDSDEDPVDLILDGIDGNLSRRTGLSNGDTITYTWEVDQSLKKDLNVDLKYSADETKVEGLKDLTETDVFEGVEVRYSGVEPHGTATVNTEDSEYDIDASLFVLDRSDGLSNGETVTVSIPEESLETLGTDYGLVPDEKTKEFTVGGLSHYAANAGEIPGDTLEDAINQTQDKLTSALNEQWSVGEDGIDNGEGGPSRQLESIEFLGYYFFKKESEGNELFFVYEIHALQNKDENGNNELTDPIVYYWFADYSDIEIREDGSCEIPSEYRNPVDMLGDGASFDSEYTFELDGNQTGSKHYVGYMDLYDLGSTVVEALPDYTLTDDTTVEEEETPEENDGEGEPADEAND